MKIKIICFKVQTFTTAASPIQFLKNPISSYYLLKLEELPDLFHKTLFKFQIQTPF